MLPQQILDLSHTRIKSLPKSLFKLVQLWKFILRCCELFKELPTEVREVCNLEVLDLKGTEIICCRKINKFDKLESIILFLK